MAIANPLWGAARIRGALLKLRVSVSQSSVAKYMRPRRRPPSQSWCTFLANHAAQIVATDFFVVRPDLPAPVRARLDASAKLGEAEQATRC
jgi:hypothetical protein